MQLAATNLPIHLPSSLFHASLSPRCSIFRVLCLTCVRKRSISTRVRARRPVSFLPHARHPSGITFPISTLLGNAEAWLLPWLCARPLWSRTTSPTPPSAQSDLVSHLCFDSSDTTSSLAWRPHPWLYPSASEARAGTAPHCSKVRT